MKTTLDVEEIIFNEIKESGIKGLIGGDIYKHSSRPTNSADEDVVIGCVAVSDGQFQEAIANVNIYVPNLDVDIKGIHQSVANSRRLKQLSKVLYPIISNIRTGEWRLDVLNQSVLTEVSWRVHIINFRVKLINLNIND